MNLSRIRGFLLQLPKPHTVRVTGDGEPQELKPGRSYAKLAETIAALGVDLIEVLDADGKVMRATRMGGAEAHRSDAAEVPAVLATDPHAAMLTHFANLLHRAYEHSTEIAFTKMVELADKMGDRSDAIEQRLERAEARNRQLMQEQVDAAFETAEEVAARAGTENGDLMQQIAGGFLQGAVQGRAKAANGKGQG